MSNQKSRTEVAHQLETSTVEEIIAKGTPDPEFANLSRHQSLEIDPDKPLIIIIIGTSGAGKDTTIEGAFLTAPGLLKKAVTGTSRGRRYSFLPKILKEAEADQNIKNEISRIEKEIEALNSDARSEHIDQLIADGWLDPKTTEPADSHIWIRAQLPGENDETYGKNLIEEYELIEYDQHHGNHYGLPKASLDTAVSSGSIPLVRTETAGAKTIFRKLKDEYNVVLVAILPEDFEFMREILSMRDNTEIRYKESITMALEFPDLVHFILHNRKVESAEGEQPVPEETIRTLIDLVKGLSR